MDDAKRDVEWEHIARSSQLSHLAALSSLEDMRRTFRGAQSRHRFLERLRFPDGFVCPRCKHADHPTRPLPGVIACPQCGDALEIRARTIFEDDAVPLSRWFDLFWCIASGEPVLDTRSVARWLELQRPEDARQHVQALRAVLVHAESAPLSGVVEVDARVVDLGAVHALVLCAVERAEGGRARLRYVQNLAAASVQNFVSHVVTPGAMVRTDCWSSYLGTAPATYLHEVAETAQDGMAQLPAVEATITSFRSWLRTREVILAEELGLSLDEFCVRFNRASRVGDLFCQLLGVALDPLAVRGFGRKRRLQSGVRAVSPQLAALSVKKRAG
ncbi:MAG TPA: IS1595 family transposase [Polyangiaceae bacterium]|jgi:hypothetical protein|nr:IS1595 family transposase [Polyangiaceae bacterium]